MLVAVMLLTALLLWRIGVWAAVVALIVLVAAWLAGPFRKRQAATAASRRRIEAAVQAREARDSGLQDEHARVASMTGPQFEHFVAHLLERDQCEDVRVSGGAGDRGADVTAISPYGWRVVVQCKRYAPGRPVGDPEMQRFLGTVHEEHRAEIALFVTTSRFTRAARELGTRRHVVLVDGERLATWMLDGPSASPLPKEPVEDAI